VLEKSFFYQEILHKGREEGRLEERLSSIELALNVKFGSEGLKLISTISEIADLEILRTIYKYVLTVNTLDEFRELIQNIHTLEIN
jgi:predicted transposase YdaD